MPHRPTRKALSGPFLLSEGVGSQDSDKTIRTTRIVVMMWTMMLHPPFNQCQRKTDTDGKAQGQVKGKLFHAMYPLDTRTRIKAVISTFRLNI
jgi:hypothetical protein